VLDYGAVKREDEGGDRGCRRPLQVDSAAAVRTRGAAVPTTSIRKPARRRQRSTLCPQRATRSRRAEQQPAGNHRLPRRCRYIRVVRVRARRSAPARDETRAAHGELPRRRAARRPTRMAHQSFGRLPVCQKPAIAGAGVTDAPGPGHDGSRNSVAPAAATWLAGRPALRYGTIAGEAAKPAVRSVP